MSDTKKKSNLIKRIETISRIQEIFRLTVLCLFCCIVFYEAMKRFPDKDFRTPEITIQSIAVPEFIQFLIFVGAAFVAFISAVNVALSVVQWRIDAKLESAKRRKESLERHGKDDAEVTSRFIYNKFMKFPDKEKKT